MDELSYRFVEETHAPEFFADALHDVQVTGTVVRFVLVALRRAPNGSLFGEPPLTCVMPVSAVGPAIGLVLRKMPTLILPTRREANSLAH